MYACVCIADRQFPYQHMVSITSFIQLRPMMLIVYHHVAYTDKKEYQIFLIYTEIQMGSVAKSYMRKGFLICEEVPKCFIIYQEAFGHI